MWYAAPDYARLTAHTSDNAAALMSHYEYIGMTVADWVGEDVSRVEPWGFNGYLGHKCGPAAWGAGYNGLILQVEGAGAEKLRSLNPYHDNVARLDVQVTIWYHDDKESLARELAPVVDGYRRSLSHRPFGLELRQGYGRGDTLYLGSRKSARYHRIYDKGRAPNGGEGYKNAWRFEVELKDGCGNGPWSDTGGYVPSPEWWAALVVREFRDRGVELPGCLPGALAPAARVPRGKTDAQRRLQWLAAQVAPSIARIRAAGVPEWIVERALTGDREAHILWASSRNENRTFGAGSSCAPDEQQQKAAT